jgi:hypothetical protein
METLVWSNNKPIKTITKTRASNSPILRLAAPYLEAIRCLNCRSFV